MSKPYLFELCADSLEAALAAQAGGADRIELCEQLAIAGVTPSAPLLARVLDAVSIPVYVLIRPRGGDFVYTTCEFAGMRQQIEQAKAAGVAGVVVGVLHPDGTVDVARTRELVELARPLRVTFHRAFDETSDLARALEDVIRTGVDCLLTSGGAANVLAGAEQIGRTRKQAGGRLEVMAGGGLKLATLADVVRLSGVRLLHGSLSRGGGRSAHEDDVREAVRLLRRESQETTQAVEVPAALVP